MELRLILIMIGIRLALVGGLVDALTGRVSASPETKVGVTVFCGFLGAGKTTLLRHLLSQAATAGEGGGRARWAAVVNDVAAVNIDGAVVQADNAALAAHGAEGAAEVVELGNGCVCCSGADDLGEAIAGLARSGRYEHIWVETSGVADPRGVAVLFTRKNPFGQTLADYARLAALVTVVDVVALAGEAARAELAGRVAAGSAERPVFELMLEQIECADVIVLNQCDRATEAGGERERAESLAAGLNARAEVVVTERGQVAAEFFTGGRMRFEAAGTLGAARWVRELNRVAQPAPGGLAARPRPAAGAKPYHESRYSINSFVYRARRPFDADRLRMLFAGGLQGVLRAKGFFWTTRSPDEMGFLSLAGGVVRWETLSVWWAARIAAGRARLEERPESVVVNWVEPFGDRRQEIVLIGVRVTEREAELAAALDGCLVS
jgi:G3E family GTPase